MGNCLRRESSSSSSSVHRWAGDEWEWEASPEMIRDEEGETREGQKGNLAAASDLSTAGKKRQEVKIKITRKQLEELLGRVDVKEVTVEQVLVYFMDTHDRFEENQRSWRPVLQSIPE